MDKNKQFRSPIEGAIWTLSDKHQLDERVDVARSKPSANQVCPIATNDESRFMVAFFVYLMRTVGPDQILPSFHKYYYTPNRRSERKLGCDVSIGSYMTGRRLNIMYKLLNRKWCDQSWKWHSDRNPKSADRNNIKLLLERHAKEAELLPLLVISVCYCVHEYRRMGDEHNGFRIPEIKNPLRTVVVDLAKLTRDCANWAADSIHKDFRLTVERKIPSAWNGVNAQAYLDRVRNKGELTVTIQPSGETISARDENRTCFMPMERVCYLARWCCAQC